MQPGCVKCEFIDCVYCIVCVFERGYLYPNNLTQARLRTTNLKAHCCSTRAVDRETK